MPISFSLTTSFLLHRIFEYWAADLAGELGWGGRRRAHKGLTVEVADMAGEEDLQ